MPVQYLHVFVHLAHFAMSNPLIISALRIEKNSTAFFCSCTPISKILGVRFFARATAFFC